MKAIHICLLISSRSNMIRNYILMHLQKDMKKASQILEQENKYNKHRCLE